MLSLLFLLELHRAHPADSLFPLNSLFLSGLEDLLIFNSELPALNIEAIQGGDDGIGITWLAEVGKGETTEGASLIKVVVEGVRGRNRERFLQKRVRME